MSTEATGYDAGGIQVLDPRDVVRKRPGMYVGSTDERGLHQMVFEIIHRAVNEIVAGHASCVDVTLTPDRGVSVVDDGPGVAVDQAEDGLEALLTQMRTGPRSGDRHNVMVGLVGVGPSVVNSLSSRLTAEVRRGGAAWIQEYARGVAASPPAEAGPTTRSGTTITFWPDTDIFGTAEVSFDVLAERFSELAFLNRELELSLTDRRRSGEARSARFRHPGGPRDFVAFLDDRAADSASTDTVAFECEDPRMAGTMELAFRWHNSDEARVRSYANSRSTHDGTHAHGFRDGVAAAVTAYARDRHLLTATDPDIKADQIGEGLTAVVSVKLDRPEFEGATRDVLGNGAVRACVGEAVQEHLRRWLEERPEQAASVLDRIVLRARPK